MTTTLNFACVQFAPIGGDIAHNSSRIMQYIDDIMGEHNTIDAIFFPEMALSGYDMQDMFNFPPFIDACEHALNHIAQHINQHHPHSPPIFIGTPSAKAWHYKPIYETRHQQYYNSVAMVHNGTYSVICHKYQLPTADIFDEDRFFIQGNLQGPITINNQPVGLVICEDAWHDDPIETLIESGAKIIVVLNGSPYHKEQKHEQRLQMMAYQARQHNVPIVYLNLAGAHDGIVFDGRSFALDAQGNLSHHAALFDEDIMHVSYTNNDSIVPFQPLPAPHPIASYPPDDVILYKSLVEGLRHYVTQSGFNQVLLGLSGGADSALTAVIAADALGAHNVLAVMLPSQFSSQHSIDDATQLTQNFNIATHNISIHELHQLTLQLIGPLCPNAALDESLGLAGENVQARIRGLLLMTLSNAQQRLLLTTGNKSELALGYSTLYGDSCGAYNPVLDVYKTELYSIMATRNRYKGQYGLIDATIPQHIIDKEPSAELRHNQKDTDSLPPYDVTDPILRAFIEDFGQNIDTSNMLYHDMWNKLRHSEFKRRQAAPGTKISTRSFGVGWRFPLINNFTLPR